MSLNKTDKFLNDINNRLTGIETGIHVLMDHLQHIEGKAQIGAPDHTPIPDKPEPPALLDVSRTVDSPTSWTVRYVRVDVGDVVIPAAVARDYVDHWRGFTATPQNAVVLDLIRAQQGGAA